MRKRVLGLGLVVLLLLLPAAGVLAASAPQPQIDIDHMIIVPGQNGFQVQEIVSVINSDSKAFAGDQLTDPAGKKKNGWVFPLPAGFQNLEIQGFSKDDYAAVADGVQVYKPLNPGQNQIAMVYDLSVSGLPATVVKKFAFSTQTFYVYTPKDYLSISSNSLQPAGSYQISGNEYLQYAAQSLNPGAVVDLSVTQAPAGQASGAGNMVAQGYHIKLHPDAHVALFTTEPLVYTNPHIWAAYIFVMLGLGIAAIILFYRMKSRPLDEDNPVSDEDEEENLVEDQQFIKLKAKQDLLLQRIKSLDERYKAGGIEEQEYWELREKYKQLLVQVKLELRDLT